MKIIFMLLMGSTFSFSSLYAENYEKNGYPCMSDVCLGDDLVALQKVKWEPAKIRDEGRRALKKVKKKYRGSDEDLLKAAPYLSGKFDNEGLKFLQNVKASCQIDAVGGKFITENGNKTNVVIMLMGPPSKQKWKVTMIKREFEGAVTDAQKKEIITTLVKRYEKFTPAAISKSKIKPKAVMLMPPVGKLSVQFTLVEGLSSDNELKSDPECGGNAKVSVD